MARAASVVARIGDATNYVGRQDGRVIDRHSADALAAAVDEEQARGGPRSDAAPLLHS